MTTIYQRKIPTNEHDYDKYRERERESFLIKVYVFTRINNMHPGIN